MKKKSIKEKKKESPNLLKQKIEAIKNQIIQKRWNNDLLQKKLEKTSSTFFQIEKKLQNRSKDMKKFFE